MKTIIPILACVALSAVIAPSQSSAGGVPFENPVFRENAPDPTVWQVADGTFRASSTAKEILKSSDMVHWEKTGRKLLLDDEMKWINRHWAHIWAPNVVKIGDRYLAYVTYHTTGEHTAIAVYSSKNGEGPFTDGKIILTSEGHGRHETIDANAVQDPDTGKVWFFFGHGDIRRVELKPNGLGIAPGAPIEHVAGVELGKKGIPMSDKRFPNNFTEGAYVYRHDGSAGGSWTRVGKAEVSPTANTVSTDTFDASSETWNAGWFAVVAQRPGCATIIIR